MKKLSLLFAIVLAFTMASQAQIKLGLKAGLNGNNIGQNYSGDMEETETKFRAGFHVGATIDYSLMETFSIQTGLMYTSKGFSIDIEEEYGGDGVDAEGYDRYSFNYLEIPIHAAYKFGGFQVYAGPYVAFGIAGKNKWDVTVSAAGVEETYSDETSYKPFYGEVGEGDLGEDEDAFRGLDYGLNFGVGYEVGPILINAGYSLGLGNLNPDFEGSAVDASDYKWSNRVLSLSASYYFMQ